MQREEDPTPDIHGLFLAFNVQYFESKLDSVQLEWSTKMTRCAGLCCYQRRSKWCRIKLSEPLLKFRPRSDLIDTLLHEMIHAYLFVTENNTDHDGHGPNFQGTELRMRKDKGPWPFLILLLP